MYARFYSLPSSIIHGDALSATDTFSLRPNGDLEVFLQNEGPDINEGVALVTRCVLEFVHLCIWRYKTTISRDEVETRYESVLASLGLLRPNVSGHS